MSIALKSCPFCGSTPEVIVKAYTLPPTPCVSATIYCPSCKSVTDNPGVREQTQVKQSVFWTGEEILKHVPAGLQLGRDFDPTTAKAAKSKAREIVIGLWQQRSSNSTANQADRLANKGAKQMCSKDNELQWSCMRCSVAGGAELSNCMIEAAKLALELSIDVEFEHNGRIYLLDVMKLRAYIRSSLYETD